MEPRTAAIGTYTTRPAMISAALIVLAITFISIPAHAKKTCSAYKVTIGTKVYSGKQTILVPASKVNNLTAHVQGKFTDFFVDMNNFTVTNYVLKGTPVYNSKTPTLAGNLTSPLFLKLNNEQIVLQRSRDGEDDDIKIQAKDCDNGGTFQMEPDSAAQEQNELATGLNYCLLDSVSGKLFFTNGPLLGYDSQQLATLIDWSSNTATWAVDAGGRIGMVTGEDAQEALALTGNGASCGR